jgi:ketosteroid isomerase-like protein
MKRLFFLAAVSISTGALCATMPTGHSPIPESLKIELLEHQWTQAAANGDRPVLNDILDDRFFEVFPGEIHRSKRDLLASVAMPPGGSQTLEDVRVQVLDNVAVATGINYYKPAYGYKAIAYRFTDVFVKREDGWRVAASRMRRMETGSI